MPRLLQRWLPRRQATAPTADGSIPICEDAMLAHLERFEKGQKQGDTVTLLVKIPRSVYPVEFLDWEGTLALGEHVASLQAGRRTIRLSRRF